MPRPHVLFLMADDHRHDAMGCAGDPWIATPTMDRLAADGLRCTQARIMGGHSPAVCIPSRACMNTGRGCFSASNGIGHRDLQSIPAQHTTMGEAFTAAGYRMVMNQDRARAGGFRDELLAQYRRLDGFLREHAPDGPFLFERFGFAEAVFAPMFMRFWFLDYYEDFALPETDDYARVRRWREACLDHPAARQVTPDQIVKLYYDYAKGAGNGALLPGRRRSSFVFEPDWRDRPMPLRDKWNHSATDAELGLV